MRREFIRIEVVYAEPHRVLARCLELAVPARVADALAAAAADPLFAELDLVRASVGVFGQRVGPERLLEPGDRVEIYRPLAVDPRTARRARAAQARRVQPRRAS